MGIRFYKLPPENPTAGHNEPGPDGIVYVVCRIQGDYCEERKRIVERIYLEGVGLDKSTAIRMCRDETYFIGPMPANVSLPRRPVEWIGVEFPLRKADGQT